MFGKKPLAFGRRNDGPSAPPPPIGGDNEFPIRKMRDALELAIALCSDVLLRTGRDCGTLGIHRPYPPNVGRQLAECITYNSENQPSFLALGQTKDFIGFSYQPHCSLFLIINAIGIAESIALSPQMPTIALRELCSRALVNAHLMRNWIDYIQPTGKALGDDAEVMTGLLVAMRKSMRRIFLHAPDWLTNEVDVEAQLVGWGGGWPGTLTHPLKSDTARLNGLPLTPFIEQVLTNFLVEAQMNGNRMRS